MEKVILVVFTVVALIAFFVCVRLDSKDVEKYYWRDVWQDREDGDK